jgi:hypothetical protein
LVRVDFSGGIGIAGHLPAGAVNRLEAGLHGLNGLISGHATQSRDHGFAVQLAPEFLGTHARQGILDVHGAAQARHVFGGVGALDAGPAVGRLVGHSILLMGEAILRLRPRMLGA